MLESLRMAWAWFYAGNYGVSHGVVTLLALAVAACLVVFLGAPKFMLVITQVGAMVHWWRRESLGGRREYSKWSLDSRFDFWVPTAVGWLAVDVLWWVL